MANDYIRKADAVDELRFEPIFSDAWNALREARDRIKAIKPADVTPVIHSRWIQTADGEECENCGREAVYQIVDGYWEYEPWCPHCGAIMDAYGEE